MIASGTLLVLRPRQYADMMRDYCILVDGREIGSIRRGQEFRVELSVGEHQILARIDWCRSNCLVVGIRSGEVTEVEVGNNCKGWGGIIAALFHIAIAWHEYLYLRHRVTGFPVR